MTTTCGVGRRRKFFPPSTELLRASAGEGKYQGTGARHIDDSPPFQLDRGGVIGLDAVAGGSPYGRHHDRSSGSMLLTGKLAGAAQLGIGRHRRRAVPPARLTAGRGPARRSGGRLGTTGTTGREVHCPARGSAKDGRPRSRSGRTAGAADRAPRREEPARADGLGWQGP